ncbi:nucleoid-associated protein EbfC [Thermostichus sp. OS-CIW-23]
MRSTSAQTCECFHRREETGRVEQQYLDNPREDPMTRGFGPFGKIQEALKKAQEVRDGAQRLQKELEEMEIVGEAGNGLVKVTVNGNQEPLKVSLDPQILQESVDVVEDLLLTAMVNAYTQSAETMRKRMEELTGNISLPGLGLG